MACPVIDENKNKYFNLKSKSVVLFHSREGKLAYF